jgi:hypothetical protein
MGEERVPNDWLSGLVIPLHKKSDKMNLDNYRGITLMDVVGKHFQWHFMELNRENLHGQDS